MAADRIEDLIAESQHLQQGLLDTTAQLDAFIILLSDEIEQLRDALPKDVPNE